MARQFFSDLPDTSTPLRASRLNGLLDGEEPMGQLVVDSIRSKNMFDKNTMVYSTNAYLPYDTSNTQLKYINNLAGVLVIKLNEGKTYTISKIAGGRFRGGFTNTPTPVLDTNNVITSRVNNNDTGTSITFTVPTNNPYFVCNFYSADQTADVNAGYSNILNSIQVEEGTSATTYFPYQKLDGNYDYINDRTMINKFTTIGATTGKYLSSDGNEVINSGFSYTDYIDVEENTQYSITAGTTDLSNAPAICFYNSNKIFISGVAFQNSFNKVIKTPANTKYVRISYANILSSSFSFNMININDLYSTDEYVIGRWIDGHKIYRKVVEFGAMPNATASSKQHGISNIYKIVHIGGYWEKNGSFNTLPNVNPSSQSASVNVSANSSVIWIQTGTDRTDCTATVVLEYTKTTD